MMMSLKQRDSIQITSYTLHSSAAEKGAVGNTLTIFVS